MRLALLALIVAFAAPGAALAQPARQISVTDHRTEAAREHSSDLFDAIKAMDDDYLTPPALSRFAQAISDRIPGDEPLEIVVDYYALMDYFPMRLRAGFSGTLTGDIINSLADEHANWDMINEMGLPPNGEAAIFIFRGSINGRPIQVATFATYRSPLFAVSARGGPFHRAIDEAIAKASSDAVAAYIAAASPVEAQAEAPA